MTPEDVNPESEVYMRQREELGLSCFRMIFEITGEMKEALEKSDDMAVSLLADLYKSYPIPAINNAISILKVAMMEEFS